MPLSGVWCCLNIYSAGQEGGSGRAQDGQGLNNIGSLLNALLPRLWFFHCAYVPSCSVVSKEGGGMWDLSFSISVTVMIVIMKGVLMLLGG